MSATNRNDPSAETGAAQLASEYLNGVRPSRELILALPKALARTPTFGLGLRVFQFQLDDRKLKLNAAEIVALGQSAALCAYKDPDVPLGDGLDRAFEILERHCRLHESDDPETLGLAGSILKRKWERQGRTGDLRSSLSFYRRSFMGAGWESRSAPENTEEQKRRIVEDQGYNAINAAFMSDVFASTLEAAGELEAAKRHRDEARRVRALILETLASAPGDSALKPPETEEASAETRKAAENRYWVIATKLEAALGIGQYETAKELAGQLGSLALFATPQASKDNSWLRESTATQLAKLVRMLAPDPADEEPRKVIAAVLGAPDDLAAAGSIVLGRVGLALSGGGFRAALYHIGVLARLAELDVLRHVEVISTVSGGSIVGAAYYLLLKRRFEQKGELDQEDYLEIVDVLERCFLAAVQTDMRSTLYSELPARLGPLLEPGKPIGEALSLKLEQLFYRPEFESAESGGGPPSPPTQPPTQRLYLDELLIHPAGDRGFHPRHHNWDRHSKVPQLVINATVLNTGHVWQFMSSYAGESPYAIDQEVDSNDRLRRFYYAPRGGEPDQPHPPIPERRIELGTAVAASASVPGLFPAVELEELYDGYGVRLVDGGVHDNQGVISLLEQDCTQIIVSDACGQMTTDKHPHGVAIAPLLRSNAIGMERVRQEEYRRLEALRESALLDGFLFVHLRQDLAGDAVDWENCEDLRPMPVRPERLDHGVRREYQEALAAMRTDLDAFSDVEAYALMYSGYSMTTHRFEEALPDLDRLAPASPPSRDWRFLSVEKLMTEHPPADGRHARFRTLLQEGGKLALRDASEATIAEHLVPRGAKALCLGALAAVPLITALVWYLSGLRPALWTLLGLVSGIAVTVGLALTLLFRAVRKAIDATDLDRPGNKVQNFLFAIAMLCARRFSIFHLAHYKDSLLDRGTVASLDANAAPT